MTTKDLDLECYGANLEATDKAMYAHLFGETIEDAVREKKITLKEKNS